MKFTRGNILEAPAEALVNPVNTMGVMGKGLALQFKRAFPDNYRAYVVACKRGEVQIGRVFVHDRGSGTQPRYIVNFPTKRDWRHPSRLEWVEAGLLDLARWVQTTGVRSIAVPALGAGLGGLPWPAVKRLIHRVLGTLQEVEVLVYEPRTP